MYGVYEVKNSSQRVEWIDAIKGLGIILVLVNHSCGFGKYGNLFTACYMPLFFMAAGFTLKPEKIIKNNVFVLQRSKRLLIPWAVYGFAFVILNFFSSLFRSNLTWEQIGVNFGGMLYSRYCLFPLGTQNNTYFLMCYNNYTWFFTALFLAYVWMYGYIKAKKQYQSILIIFYSTITLLLSFCPVLLPWSIDTSFMIALFIMVGYYLKKWGFMNLSGKANILVLLISLLVYILCATYNGDVNLSVRIYGEKGALSVFLFFIIGASGTIFCATLFKLLHKIGITTVASYIGRHSITILCIHLFIFNVIQSAINLRMNKYISGVIMITITMLCSFALNWVFKWLSKYIKVFQYL